MPPTESRSPVRFSICTALFNCLDLTRAYLASLEETMEGSAVGYEVILVDDGSSDGTREFLKTLKPPYRILLNEENLGFAGSNNRAAESARGEYLFFLNNDLVLRPGWLEPMADGMEMLPMVGVLGNIQMNPQTGLVDHAGVFFDLKGLPAHARKGRSRIPRQDYREWYAVTAACMLIRRDVFLSAGGFDEGYRNGMEDIDLCVRLRLEGYRHYVANRSVVEHFVSSSPGRHTHNDANTERFRKKWSATTMEWGRREWAGEYLQRYARRWWRYNFTKFWRAVWLILSRPRLDPPVSPRDRA